MLILVATNRLYREFRFLHSYIGDVGSGNNHFRISVSNLKQRRAFSLKCFLPGNVVADLNINLFATSLSNKVDFLLIELADIDIISTAKKLDTNNVFIYSAIVYISASQYCISNTAVTQIELFRAFKVFLTSDVISLNIIKYKSIAQILNVLADGLHDWLESHLLSVAD